MKTRPNALRTAEKVSSCAKHESRTERPRSPPKMSPGMQNMKTGPEALGKAENEYGGAKHKNGTRRPKYNQK
jgi:hypothetical protein